MKLNELTFGQNRAFNTGRTIKRTVTLLAAFAVISSCAFKVCASESKAEIKEDTAAVVIKNGNASQYTKDSMDAAWKDSQGAVLKLMKDWEPEAAMVIPGGAAVTLDLNGHIIDRGLVKYKDDGCLFSVSEGASFRMIDSDHKAAHIGMAVSGGILTGGKSGNTAGCIDMKKGSSVKIEGCSILSCATQQDGGAIRMNGVCALTADGTGFYSNYTIDSSNESYGGAIYIGDGSAFIKNCVFDGNYSEDDGGAVYMNDGEFQISGTMFRSNHSKEEGGAIYCNGTYNESAVNGCSFISNSADEDGGAIYVNSCKQLVMNNSVFSLNTTKENGGAVYVVSDRVILANSTVTGNKAEKNGGGIYVDSMHDIGVQGKVIVRNNTNSTGKNNDLCLQNGNTSTAYLSNGGLYEGSMIYLTSTSNGNILASKEISKFQSSNYIRTNKGSAVLDETKAEAKEERFVSSVIGKGSSKAVVAGSLIILLSILCVVFRPGKKSKPKKGENK